jgi:antitoxin (DNA-binding transcriptional repressor) of toxin-antitoxin stability system
VRGRAVARIIAAEDPGSLRNQFTNFASRSQAVQQVVEEKPPRLDAEKSPPAAWTLSFRSVI